MDSVKEGEIFLCYENTQLRYDSIYHCAVTFSLGRFSKISKGLMVTLTTSKGDGTTLISFNLLQLLLSTKTSLGWENLISGCGVGGVLVLNGSGVSHILLRINGS